MKRGKKREERKRIFYKMMYPLLHEWMNEWKWRATTKMRWSKKKEARENENIFIINSLCFVQKKCHFIYHFERASEHVQAEAIKKSQRREGRLKWDEKTTEEDGIVLNRTLMPSRILFRFPWHVLQFSPFLFVSHSLIPRSLVDNSIFHFIMFTMREWEILNRVSERGMTWNWNCCQKKKENR